MAQIRIGSDDILDVLGRLLAEFGDRIDVDTIRSVAVQEVALFDKAKIRTFVPLISWRLARSHLLERLEPHGSA